MAGLLAWNLFSVSLSNGAQSVIANANLVKKVYFPREILPLATVGVCLVDFVLQSLVLVVFFVVFYGFQLDVLWVYPFAFVALLLITVAITMFVSALNVRYRDVQHLIGLALLVWFWMTPDRLRGSVGAHEHVGVATRQRRSCGRSTCSTP